MCSVSTTPVAVRFELIGQSASLATDVELQDLSDKILAFKLWLWFDGSTIIDFSAGTAGQQSKGGDHGAAIAAHSAFCALGRAGRIKHSFAHAGWMWGSRTEDSEAEHHGGGSQNSAEAEANSKRCQTPLAVNCGVVRTTRRGIGDSSHNIKLRGLTFGELGILASRPALSHC